MYFRNLVILFGFFLPLFSGCAARDRETPSTTRRASEDVPRAASASVQRGHAAGAVLIGQLWNEYVDDPAGAAKRYADGVDVAFTVDVLDVTPGGYVATRRIDHTTHKIYLPKSAGDVLQGSIGQVVTARGRVERTRAAGLVIRCD